VDYLYLLFPREYKGLSPPREGGCQEKGGIEIFHREEGKFPN